MSILEQVSQPAAPWTTILISWLGSGFLSAAITGIYSLRATRNAYVLEYYKIIFNRRLGAYEKVEALIVWLKASVLDNDGRPYHMLFASQDEHGWMGAYGVVTDVLSQSLWLTDEVFTKARELSDLMFHLDSQQHDLIEFGKKNYETIAGIRTELERLLAKDLLSLPDVKAFLKGKNNPDPGFRDFKFRNR